MYNTRYSKSRALIIGINAYDHVNPLACARQDAVVVAETLIARFGFLPEDVTTLLDEHATGDAIRAAFLRLAADDVLPDERVLVFFAGHGTTRSGRRGEVGHLVPVDGHLERLQSLIRWDELTRNAELIQAKHLLFVMDACYGGLALTRAAVPGTMRFLKDMLRRYSRQVLTAGKADETVADADGPRAGHSVFTGHFLNALDGEAMAPSGIISANAVMAYVYDKVASDVHSHQTPHYGFIDGDGDFIFSAGDTDLLAEAPEGIESDILVAVPAHLVTPGETREMTLSGRLKEHLAHTENRIKLDDEVNGLIRRALAKLDPGQFPLTAQFTPEVMQARLSKYEDAVSELVVAAILLARWGEAVHLPMLVRILTRLADLNETVGGQTIWIGLRWYPLSLLIYYAGISALAVENYPALIAIFHARTGERENHESSRHVFARANSGLADCHEAFKALPGRGGEYTPRSELFLKVLQPLLEDELFLGRTYEELFDRFESFNALVHADVRGDTGRFWGPPGRFAWKMLHEPNGGPFKRLTIEAAEAGAGWKPVTAGLFRSSQEHFQQIAEKYAQVVVNLPYY